MGIMLKKEPDFDKIKKTYSGRERRKKPMKRIISALLAAAFALGPALLPASASSGEREAEIIYRDIKITLDGQAVNPLDADGNPAEPFI